VKRIPPPPRGARRRAAKRFFASAPFVVPKAGGGSRPVLDLRELNEYIEEKHIKMEGWPDLPPLVERGSWMGKLDLKSAYLHVQIAPEDQSLLAFGFRGQWYKATALMFGLRNAPRLFTRLMRPVARELRRRGIRCLFYLDDIFVTAPGKREATHAIRETVQLLEQLGWLINVEKSTLEPVQRLCYLGLVVDTINMEIRAPREKTNKIRQAARAVLSRGSFGDVRDAQRLLGRMEALARAVRGARIYMRPLQRLWLAHQRVRGQAPPVLLDVEASAALRWWANEAHQHNGVPLKQPLPSRTLTTDASEWGWGAVLGRGARAAHRWPAPQRGQHINMLELLAVRNALDHFQSELAGRTVQLRVDSTVAIWYIKKSGGPIRPLSQVAEQIGERLLHWGVTPLLEYVPSTSNVADLLSRGGRPAQPKFREHNWELSWRWFRELQRRWGPLDVDLFASAWNRKLHKFCGLHPHPDLLAIDAFSLSWKRRAGLYANPPFRLLGRVIDKLIKDKASAVVVYPRWPSAPWWPPLRDLRVGDELVLPRSPGTFLPDRESGHIPFGAAGWEAAAALLDGARIRRKPRWTRPTRDWTPRHGAPTGARGWRS
jgi:hypothetical protein